MLPLKYLLAQRSLLSGGLVNTCYSLQLVDERCYLREGSPHAHQLGIHRYRELNILQHAVVAGWAPEILHIEPETGLLVTRWVDDEPLPLCSWQTETGLQRLGHLMASIHGSALDGTHQAMHLDMANQIRFYLARICVRSSEQSMFANKSLQMLSQLAPVDHVLCHNDINPGNLLGSKPWVVDWEYAAFGDPAFDLAVLGRNFELSTPQLTKMLCHYHDRGGYCSIERVMAMLPVVDVINLLWLAVYKACSKQPLLDSMYQSLLERMMAEKGGW